MVVKNGICHAELSEVPLHAIGCSALDGHRVRVEFNDGSVKDVDLEPLFSFPAFRPLSDPAVFRAFSIYHGIVTWRDGEIDIAPEWLYEHGTICTYPSADIKEPSVAEEQAVYGVKK